MPWPSGFPPWQEAELYALSKSNKLSGLDPLIIAGIEEAETGGWSGGAINPQGYGGYFGLSTADGPSASELRTGGGAGNPSAATKASYTVQAQDAASIFATQLSRYGGDVGKAETAYQDGSYGGTLSSGATDVLGVLGGASAGNPNPSKLVGPGGASGGGGTAKATSTTTPVNLPGVAGVLQQLNDVLNPAMPGLVSSVLSLGSSDVATVLELVLVRGLFAVGFLGLTWLGIKQFTGGSGGTNIIEIAQTQQRISQADTRAETAKAREERLSKPPPVRRSESYRYVREEKVHVKRSDIHHHTTPKPSSKGSRAKAGSAAASDRAVAAQLTEGAIGVL